MALITQKLSSSAILLTEELAAYNVRHAAFQAVKAACVVAKGQKVVETEHLLMAMLEQPNGEHYCRALCVYVCMLARACVLAPCLLAKGGEWPC